MAVHRVRVGVDPAGIADSAAAIGLRIGVDALAGNAPGAARRSGNRAAAPA